MAKPVTIPLINPNEPDALLIALYVKEGQRLAAGDLIATLETTKSTADIFAESAGFVSGLCCQTGQTVKAGEVLCYLIEGPGDLPPKSTVHEELKEVGKGQRVTKPAMALAKSLGISLNDFPPDRLVTENMVRQRFETEISLQPDDSSQPHDPRAILVYGGGGHGKSIIDLLRRLEFYQIVGILDDGISRGERVLDVPVLGGIEALAELRLKGVQFAVNAVGGIGRIDIRIEVFRRLKEAGFSCPTIVHPTAFVEASALLGDGIQIFPHAYLGSAVRVGFGCIVNTSAVVSHDCVLSDYANISPGAILAGEVEVGEAALIGMGATVNLGVRIGARARVGNGATVKEDVPENRIVRAGATWP